ncbi:DUF453-domain-containing protein [Sarocladium strictum]
MAVTEASSTRPTLHTLPCVLMRAGTSKGPFIHRKDLPQNESEWAPHLISALGSTGCDPRQIDGVGGGTSTTSKVAVVAPSARDDMDVDFTFVQVAIGKESIDLTGNCGNFISGVGPFAVQEGLVRAEPGVKTIDVRVWNTNTNRGVVETVELNEDGTYKEDGDYSIPGVNSTGSEVKIAWLDPAGSMTGKLFPSGEQQQMLPVQPPASLSNIQPFEARVTLIDSANPFIFVDAAFISTQLQQAGSPDGQHALMESIRQQGAVAMGLAASTEIASKTRGTPKIALISAPLRRAGKPTSDIRIAAYSMGLPHPTLQLSGAVCVASGLCCSGTILSDLSAHPVDADNAPVSPERTPSPRLSEDNEAPKAREERDVVIEHSKGTIDAGVVVVRENGVERIESCTVSRTARRLMEGNVRYFV